MAAVAFALFAPYNEEAALIGDFSNWEALPMTKDEGGYFRTEVDLADGRYQYKFRVRSKSWFLEEDAWVDVVDPYATLVVDDATANGVVNVKGGRRILDDYVWQHGDKPLPPDHQLVIYELHVGDFSGGEGDGEERGDYEHVTQKLNYLSDLGVNAIELMPIKQYPGDYSWGYNPRYFMAAESSYGSTQDLKHLIDCCHEREMRVIMDGVYNHSDSSAPLTQIDHDYWYHHEPQDKENNWGPEFNYEKFDESLQTYPARKYIGDVIRFWVKEYHTDGLRFDAARQLGNFDFMRWVVEEAKKTAGRKPFFAIAEHIPETPAIVGPDGPMDACWHDSFYWTMRSLLRGEKFDMEGLKNALEPRRQGFMGATNIVNYLSNHDHDHLMHALGEVGVFGEEAFRRAKLGAAFLMTAVGVPMLWMGEEFGEFRQSTVESTKLEWGLLGHEDNQGLFQHYKGLIALRKANSALHGVNINFFHENPQGRVLAYVRWNDEGSRVVVVANLSGKFLGGYQVPDFPADGTWREWTRSYDAQVEGGLLTLDLGPFEAQVFVQ